MYSIHYLIWYQSDCKKLNELHGLVLRLNLTEYGEWGGCLNQFARGILSLL